MFEPKIADRQQTSTRSIILNNVSIKRVTSSSNGKEERGNTSENFDSNLGKPFLFPSFLCWVRIWWLEIG